MTYKIKTEACVGCGQCASICPVGAPKLVDGVYVIGEECVNCGLCAENCPVDAISAE